MNLPCDIETRDGKVKCIIDDMSTGWMDVNDSFLKRIEMSNLNPDFLKKHLKKEIEIKNILDEGIRHLELGRFSKAVDCFDDVIYYDDEYVEALINKSYALKGEGHFVKAFRYYKNASKYGFKDIDYQKEIMKLANDERDGFPKIKRNIYAGDEYFSRGEFEKALESYNRALVNPSKFKGKILSKLLNKKATALLKLKRYDEAFECFKMSLNNDYARFGQGICEYELGLDINDEFKKLLKISKRQSLRQAGILNEIGFKSEAMVICDYLLENHFKTDDLYNKLMMFSHDYDYKC